MEITHKELKRCDLISVKGRIDSSKAPELEDLFNKLMEQGRYRFVLDLSELEYGSSAFLRVVISTLKTVKRFNRGNIYLAALAPRINDVFDLAGIKPLFKDREKSHIYDTVEEAVGDW